MQFPLAGGTIIFDTQTPENLPAIIHRDPDAAIIGLEIIGNRIKFGKLTRTIENTSGVIGKGQRNQIGNAIPVRIKGRPDRQPPDYLRRKSRHQPRTTPLASLS